MGINVNLQYFIFYFVLLNYQKIKLRNLKSIQVLKKKLFLN